MESSCIDGKAREMIEVRMGDEVCRDMSAYDMSCIGAGRGMRESEASKGTVVEDDGLWKRLWVYGISSRW